MKLFIRNVYFYSLFSSIIIDSDSELWEWWDTLQLHFVSATWGILIEHLIFDVKMNNMCIFSIY